MSVRLYDIFNSTLKTRSQPQHKCESKFKTYFQLKFISTIYPHGYITRSWRYKLAI